MSVSIPFRNFWVAQAGRGRLAALLLAFLPLLISGCTAATGALTPDLPAPLSSRYAAIVIDAGTGRTLYQHTAGAQRYPASLTKMMTLYLLFDALESGRVSKATAIPVSSFASRRPPSRLGLKVGQTVDVDTAIRALVTKSANDVATAVAEYLGGSEEGFAAMMNARARALGMNDTRFRNASGLPDDGQVTTARDMAVLAIALYRRFPQHDGYFAARSFRFAGKEVRGHNDLLGRVPGVDGIKTGYIRASGFNIATSVRRGGRWLVIVVMGGDSASRRNDHVEALIGRFLPSAGLAATPGLTVSGTVPSGLANLMPWRRAVPATTQGLPGVGE